MNLNHMRWVATSLLVILTTCIPDPKPIEGLPVPPETIFLSNASLEIDNLNLPNTAQVFTVTKNFTLFGLSTDYALQEVLKLFVLNLDIKLKSIETNEIVDMDVSSSGAYVYLNQNNFLKDYKRYEIIINDDEKKKSFTAESIVLPLVDFTTLYVTSSQQEKENESFIEVHFSFDDFPNQKNYYLISARKSLDANTSLANELTRDQGGFVILDDSNLFAGKINTSFLIIKRGLTFVSGDNIIVGLSHVSEDYYIYLKDFQERSQGFGFLSEPYNIDSNLSNGGLGYFSLHRTTIKIVPVP